MSLFHASPRAQADFLTHLALKRDEQLEMEEEDLPPPSAPPLLSPTSAHLAHTLHSSSSLSTFDHLQSLFHLDDSHACPCHWCLTSLHHRRARLRRQQRGWVSMVAPMVRYSHLPFRLLCRHFGADVAFTPMIIAAGFNRSQLARDADFQTNSSRPRSAHAFHPSSPTSLHSLSRYPTPAAQPLSTLRCCCAVLVSGSAADRPVRL